MLARALETIEKDPGQALTHLNDFDHNPGASEVAEAVTKFEKRPSLGNMRARFKKLQGSTS